MMAENELFFQPLTKQKRFPIMSMQPETVVDRETIRDGCTCWTKERQVMRMSSYEIIMIVIASVTLVLALIEACKGDKK